MTDSSSADTKRPSGTMQRMSNAKVLVVGLLIVSMATAGLAFVPGLFSSSPEQLNEQAQADSFVPTPVGEDETVWTANGASHTRKAVQDMLKPFATQRLLDALADPGTADPSLATNLSATLSSVISADLIAQAVAEAQVGVTDEELRTKLDEFISENFKDDATYQAALAQFDLTEAGMLQQLRFPMEAERLTDARYPIDDAVVQEQLKPLYDEKYKSGKIIRHMQFPTVEEADAAMKRLVDGEDFATVAQELSKDPFTAKKGGLIGP
ncbi:hypothetical protein, partial [Stomatohabitans albus]